MLIKQLNKPLIVKMIHFNKTAFIKSAPTAKDALFDHSHVVFIGRSNVGKSSLINAICQYKNLAFISKSPGQTKLLNHYLVDNSFYFIDAPGYGYRKTGKKDNFDSMMDSYFQGNENLKLVLWLLDSRRNPTQEDLDFYEFVRANNLKMLLVYTKMDKLNQKEKARCFKSYNQNFGNVKAIFVSSLKRIGIDELKRKIEEALS